MKRKYKGRHYYTEEEDCWLMNNSAGRTIYEITDDFNNTFGTDLRKQQLKSRTQKIGVHLEKKYKYPEEIRKFIIECYCAKKMTEKETDVAVREKFGDMVTSKTVHNYIRNNNLINGMAGRPNKGWITKGAKPKNTLEEGAISFHMFKGKRIKVIKTQRGVESYNRWLWEQHYGEIPEGYMVVSLSRTDDVQDISDLACVPHSAAVRSFKKMDDDNAEYNYNLLLISQLDGLIEEREEKRWQKKK